MNFQNIAWLQPTLAERGISPNKKFGQNFLIDQNILTFMVNAGGVCKDDIVLEIGTGTGALTLMLAEAAADVVTVEIDKRLCEFARWTTSAHDNITFVNEDVLKSKSRLNPTVISAVRRHINQKNEEDKPFCLKVISNLPYGVSTPVIIKLLESGLPINLMILTLQKEITNRLAALPRTKDYGMLSIIAQHFSCVEVLKPLPPAVFWPSPQVDSSVVMLDIYDDNAIKPIANYQLFQKIVKAIFMTRRKTILNSLKIVDMSLIDHTTLVRTLEAAGINPERRGETLTIAEIIDLSDAIDNGAVNTIVEYDV